MAECKSCGGFGTQMFSVSTGRHALPTERVCPRCHGDGREPIGLAAAYPDVAAQIRKDINDELYGDRGYIPAQSRKRSFVEACVSTAIGFVVAFVLTAIVLPAFGHNVTAAENFWITSIFTVVSVIRSYAVRRLFEAWR